MGKKLANYECMVLEIVGPWREPGYKIAPIVLKKSLKIFRRPFLVSKTHTQFLIFIKIPSFYIPFYLGGDTMPNSFTKRLYPNLFSPLVKPLVIISLLLI